jgi:glycosyltransferase involved in cell wall biosynthesis
LQSWPDKSLFLSSVERAAWGVPQGIVVPNAVDLNRFHPRMSRSAARQDLALSEDAKVVLYLGGIGVIKGLFPLLEALRSLSDVQGLVCLMPATERASSKSLKARIVRGAQPFLGPITARQKMEETIREFRLQTICHKMPFVNGVEKLMAAADVVVFPALENHFARPAIEAAAMGRPVIASRLPTLEEIVDDGKSGLLVPPGDVAALAGAIRRVLEDRSLAEALGARGRAQAEERFDLRVQIETIMRTYDDVLGSRTSRM